MNKVPILKSGMRHRISGFNSRFHGGDLNFSDYAARARQMLFEVHSRAKADSIEKRVNGNAPFELWPEHYQTGHKKPFKRGILLIHGLTDSPYFMRHLAKFFQENGWPAMAVLLPGHGTQPGDLLDVNWQEWDKAVRFGVEQLCINVDEIYLLGLSAGAALGLLHSLGNPLVRGLFLFSPALRITSRAACANVHKLYSWMLPAAKWVEIKPDIDIYKYESFPKNAAYQMHILTRLLQLQLRRREMSVPVFTAASEDDTTVESPATLEFMARTHHPASRLVYYKRDPSVSPPGVEKNRIELVGSVVPEQRIISFSHTSLVLPAEDEHYGVNGEYSNCLHYYPDNMDQYAVCLSNPPNMLQGEVTKQNLAVGTMRRLMYNPHFNELKISMQHFIESLP